MVDATSQKEFLLMQMPVFPAYMPNCGMGYIAEALSRSGIEVDVVDVNIEIFRRYLDQPDLIKYWDYPNKWEWANEEKLPSLLSKFDNEIQSAVERAVTHAAPIIGFSVNLFNLLPTNYLVGLIRQRAPEKVIIYGGFSCHFEEISQNLTDAPDYICVGESEGSAPILVKRLLEDEDPGPIPGVIDLTVESRKYVESTHEEDLEDLWPRWNGFDLTLYSWSGETVSPPYDSTKPLMIPLYASRGCYWGKCTFCSFCKTPSGFRQRSAQSVINEIYYNMDRYGDNTIFGFNDLVLNGDHAQLEAFCDEVIDRQRPVKFGWCQLHLNKFFTPQLFAKLKQAGFNDLTFGIESGSDEMLRKMKKGHTVKIIERVFSDAAEAGLGISINIIVGFPGDKLEYVMETSEFLERNQHVIHKVENVSTCAIAYGSPLWHKNEDYGVIFDPQPGEEIVGNWVSEDGQNTENERGRWRDIVWDKVKLLNLSPNQSHVNLKRVVDEKEAENRAMREWLTEVESAKEWLDQQRLNWMARAQSLEQELTQIVDR